MSSDYGPGIKQVLDELAGLVPRDDVTVHFDEGISEDLRNAAAEILKAHSELWYLEGRAKDGATILVYRGPHP
ncbi:hypothetical protein [Pseudorhizobium flavum]|uniref:hypothetical protein n=1 Tax=Pseudorhizobium flavum TaxID=1335061 RepID=UPI00376F893C